MTAEQRRIATDFCNAVLEAFADRRSGAIVITERGRAGFKRDWTGMTVMLGVQCRKIGLTHDQTMRLAIVADRYARLKLWHHYRVNLREIVR